MATTTSSSSDQSQAPASASSSATAPTFPIVDSHIHLYPADDIPTLAWCPPDGPLARQFSVEQYRAAASSAADRLRGFVFIEADRKTGEAGDDWTHPLAEVSFAARIARGLPRPGQGHTEADAPLCLGIVPWAPVAAGPEAVAKYLDAAREAVLAEFGDAKEEGEAAWKRVRGVRYLVQDKPAGTMLTDAFVESLRLLGRRGLVFDLGVDQHRRGRAQLEEAVEMIDRAHEGVPEAEKVVVILDHLCKPDLTVINPADPSFVAWRTAMFTLSRCRRVYAKLSGLLAEMPAALRARPADEIFAAALPWLAVLLAAFGAERVMFGSDWPVCRLGVPDLSEDGSTAWDRWRRVVERMCWMASLSDGEQARLWAGTAAEAYGLELGEEGSK